MAAAKPITCCLVITTLLYSLTQILNKHSRLQIQDSRLKTLFVLSLKSWILDLGSIFQHSIFNFQFVVHPWRIIDFQICKFRLTLQPSYAEVVELVDTLCSGRSARKGMRVRISPPALFHIQYGLIIISARGQLYPLPYFSAHQG